VYTHVPFDGHPDHRELYRHVVAALERAKRPATVHGTLMHPEGSDSCMGTSADLWPNPSLTGDHSARFTPWLDVEPPPVPPCGGHVTATSWGPLGPPNELVEVPTEMRERSLERNLKWQAIACHHSQVELNAGYMMAFVKRREFFWTSRHGDP
jgi:LmbE family N-acetylglucosaminyl deacetylase